MWGKVVRLPGLDSYTLRRSSFLRDSLIPLPPLCFRRESHRWSSTYWFNWSAVNIFCNRYSSHSSNPFLLQRQLDLPQTLS